ncbi:hypothetical protein [Paludisphaera mucosa]|uniref:Uncharacterized protein n=1 Tax=Paludisphaera mucosa TaxID=3030827 RepID=A0ABT6FDU5_9BACT|nr:hypothetical protein [Paludisphaera mucosa]MDG3005742.1 hypothetical protein [Paludisphaera mucosa]
MKLIEAQRLSGREIRPYVRDIPIVDVRLDLNLPRAKFFDVELNMLEGVLGPRDPYPPVFVRWDAFCQAYLVVSRQNFYALARKRGLSFLPCVEVEPDSERRPSRLAG